MPNQGYPEDNPAFPGRETVEPVTSKVPVQYRKTAEPVISNPPVQFAVCDYINQPAVHIDQTTADRVASTRKIEVTEVSPSVADGILKNAAGSTSEPVPEFAEVKKQLIVQLGLQRLQRWITAWAVSKGWLVPGQPRELLHQLMLVVSELSEACEAHREGNPKCTRPNMGEFSHVEEELADAVIRILQIAGEHNFRVVDAIIAKMEFNETRPVKHGKLC